MKHKEVVAWLLRQGYLPNKSGFWVKKEKLDSRYKLSHLILAYQIQAVYPATSMSKRESTWLRYQSGYLKNLCLGEGDQIVGLRV